MDWTRIPPLNSLRAFTALALAGNYKLAGDALNVTHAAVNQQVRQLEERIGISLVVTDGRNSKLTAEGQQLAGDLEESFSRIQASIESLTESAVREPVQVSTSPAFAMEWLMPRIQDFQNRHPDIPLLINPTAQLVNLEPGGIEVAIRYRDKRKFTDTCQTVLRSDMVVLAKPDLAKRATDNNPRSLLSLPWLQELNTREVMQWFHDHGIYNELPTVVTEMPGNLIMQALRRGDGISYTSRAFFKREIEQGELIELGCNSGVGLYLIETCQPPLRRTTRLLVDWLIGNAEECIV